MALRIQVYFSSFGKLVSELSLDCLEQLSLPLHNWHPKRSKITPKPNLFIAQLS